MALLCACEDCRQASQWAAQRGGAAPIDIYHSVYCRSDFADIVGRYDLRTTQLRADAKSTRMYCKICHACLGIDHKVSYQDNVFMFQPVNCRPDFETDIAPCAAIGLIDYPGEIAPLPTEDLPVFHTFRYPQERARLFEIDAVRTAFSPPKAPPDGTTIRQLIASMPAIEVLGLEPGACPRSDQV